MVNQLSRFQVVPHNRLVAPGKCVVCGSISGDFIDFGFTLDFYGAVYFCKDNCFREAAGQLGYVHEDVVNQYASALAEVTQEFDTVYDENRDLRNAMDIIERVRVSTIVERVSSVDVEPEQPADNQGPERAGKGSTKSSAKSGSTGVRNNDSSATDVDILAL